MKENSTDVLTSSQDIGLHASWYRGLSLTERLQALKQPASQLLPSSTDTHRFGQWKEQPFFQLEGVFEQRLAADGLSEELLQILLNEDEQSLQKRCDYPVWLAAFREVVDAWFYQATDRHEQSLKNDSQSAETIDLSSVLIPENTQKSTLLRYITVAQPFFPSFAKRLLQVIQILENSYSHLPFDPKTFFSLVRSHLANRILTRMLKTLVLELNVARVQGELSGETAEERFQHFLQRLQDADAWIALFEEYPVLTRLLIETLESWLVGIVELLQRLCADWDDICQLFPEAYRAGNLVEIQAGKGDEHRGARSVTVLKWQSGFSLVYKPRSLAIDKHFQDLLSWINTCGITTSFRTCALLDRQTHGWVEFIHQRTCQTREEVERFYWRQGGYLALLYALDAADFHHENLIADGEYPILIDLEALFQPRIKELEARQQSYPGVAIINQSVLRVGLLPQRYWSNQQGEGIDISGLGGQAGQAIPIAIPRWTEVGTDQMKLSQGTGTLPAKQHRPTLSGQDVETQEYCAAISDGFRSVYQALLEHREELLGEVLPRFAHDEIRCLLRPTQMYHTLLIDSYHPNVLRNALDRDLVFERLWVPVKQYPYLAKVIASERNDLWHGDVPVFCTQPISHDLYDSHGTLIPDFFETSAFDVVRQRIHHFSPEDLEKQLWIIQASFTSMILGEHVGKTVRRKPSSQTVQNRPVSAERLLKLACQVGDRLEKLAITHDGYVGWLGVMPVAEREWQLQVADVDLYSGLAGLTLFLAYLGKASGEQRYTDLAHQALQTLLDQAEVYREAGWASGVGAFNGLGSVIYLLAHLGQLWHDETLYQIAQKHVASIPEIIKNDRVYDIVGGAAGCLLALLSLYSVAPSEETFDAMEQCAEHLFKNAEPQHCGVGWKRSPQALPLTGFSHGNAGIALSLLRLFALNQDQRLLACALASLTYERSLFSQKRSNWPDLRSVDTTLLQSLQTDQEKLTGADYMTAWCHGAAGIVLGRLSSLALIQEYVPHESHEICFEIEQGLATTIREGFGINHSLCHGDLGNLEALLLADQLLPVEVAARVNCQEHLRRLTDEIVKDIETRGWITGVPLGVETPGLMVGLAGIGYALLRLSNPDVFPSILLLDPPVKTDLP